VNKVKKRATFVILVLFLVQSALAMSACSLPIRLPDDGIFYCEELNIAIKFPAELDEARIYFDDGTYWTCAYKVGYDSGITIESTDGNFTYFICKTDYLFDTLYAEERFSELKYTFKRIQDWP
jgi:hypothetical protein